MRSSQEEGARSKAETGQRNETARWCVCTQHPSNQSPRKVKTPISKDEDPLPEWKCKAWPQTCFFKEISLNQTTLIGQKLRVEETLGSWPTQNRSRSGVGGWSLVQAPPICTPAAGSPTPFTFYGLFDVFVVRICSSFSPVFALGFPGFVR